MQRRRAAAIWRDASHRPSARLPACSAAIKLWRPAHAVNGQLVISAVGDDSTANTSWRPVHINAACQMSRHHQRHISSLIVEGNLPVVVHRNASVVNPTDNSSAVVGDITANTSWRPVHINAACQMSRLHQRHISSLIVEGNLPVIVHRNASVVTSGWRNSCT